MYEPEFQNLLEHVDLRLLYNFAPISKCIMVPCQWHKDGVRRPNLAVYPDNVHCFKCGKHLGAFEYLKEYLGLTDEEGITRQVLELASTVQNNGVTRSKTNGSEPTDCKNLEAAVFEYQESLHKNISKIQHLNSRYGLSIPTIKSARIGYTGTAYSIPVYDFGGTLRNIRFRGDIDNGAKYWGVPGCNGYSWYYPPSMLGFSSPDMPCNLNYVLHRIYNKASVVITEGEFDCLALYQCNITTISILNGKSSVFNKDLSIFKGLTVYIMFDQDEPGREAARQFKQRFDELDIVSYNVQWDSVCGKDASELLANGWTETDFKNCITNSKLDPINRR